MFETIEEIISIVVGSVAFISALVGYIVTLVKNIKNKKIAEAAKTTVEIYELAKDKIIEVEQIYSEASQVLKSSGIQTGEIKKENVLNFIKSQCAEKGLEYDNTYWCEKLESLIKVMNVNKETPNQQTSNEHVG